MSADSVLLDIAGLGVSYPDRRRGSRRGARHRAVQHVDLRLRRGEAFGLVGESGSGKSTLGRAIMGLVPLETGRVVLDGTDLVALRRDDPVGAARRVQMDFQDALGALDPRQRIGSALLEVLGVHDPVPADSHRSRADALLASVGLGAEHFGRFPHQLSGGQRQRAGIARALALRPEVLILDEPVSALDVSVQAQILTLLSTLQRELGLTLLLIAHDLAVVRNVCDRVAVMYRGRIVEATDAHSLFTDPLHPYTRDLLEAVPRIDGRGPVPGVPDPDGAFPSRGGHERGCPYFLRCRHSKRDEGCASTPPSLIEVERGHAVACPKAR